MLSRFVRSIPFDGCVRRRPLYVGIDDERLVEIGQNETLFHDEVALM